YKATDDETKESVENINARIYSKPKGATDDEYRLFEDLKATVKINNDEKKKIIHVEIEHSFYTYNTPTVSGGTIVHCYGAHAFIIPMEEDAERYDLRIIDLSMDLANYPKVFNWR